jgi:class 3 adenylate cyclase
LKTANLAIVFTDIQGFTERTSQQTLEQNQRLLQVHAALLTPLFRSFGGRIVKSIGDAFLVTFESPTQAVLCGVALQDRLWLHNRSALEAERLEVRVAINVGEVRVEAGDVFGEPVNIAARVEALTGAGEVYFTEAVYLSMNKAEVPSEEVGAFELKGIPGRIRVLRVPKAPYRVQPAAADASPGAGEPSPLPLAEEQLPFGNLGLSRVPESEWSTSALTAATFTAQALGQKAAELTARAASLGGDMLQRTSAALSGARARRRLPVGPLLAAGVGLALFIGLLVAFRRSDVDKAIDEVAGAPESDKRSRAKVARKLISEERDANDASYDQGRLEEALGTPGHAIPYYQGAARAGHSRAQRRLLDLLESPECGVRREAAQAVGELKLEKARGRLEALAKNGGPGEDETPLFGCNSRKAAEEALRQLE